MFKAKEYKDVMDFDDNNMYHIHTRTNERELVIAIAAGGSI